MNGSPPDVFLLGVVVFNLFLCLTVVVYVAGLTFSFKPAIDLRSAMMMEIENFFYIKLMQLQGGANGGLLTVMELMLILNSVLKLVLKYCDNLKHIVLTGVHSTTKQGVGQDRLYRFQDELLNKLPKSVDLLKDCAKKAIKGG